MGGEIYLPGYEEAWKAGRELNLPIALHVVGTFGMQPTVGSGGARRREGPGNPPRLPGRRTLALGA